MLEKQKQHLKDKKTGIPFWETDCNKDLISTLLHNFDTFDNGLNFKYTDKTDFELIFSLNAITYSFTILSNKLFHEIYFYFLKANRDLESCRVSILHSFLKKCRGVKTMHERVIGKEE